MRVTKNSKHLYKGTRMSQLNNTGGKPSPSEKNFWTEPRKAWEEFWANRRLKKERRRKEEERADAKLQAQLDAELELQLEEKLLENPENQGATPTVGLHANPAVQNNAPKRDKILFWFSDMELCAIMIFVTLTPIFFIGTRSYLNGTLDRGHWLFIMKMVGGSLLFGFAAWLLICHLVKTTIDLNYHPALKRKIKILDQRIAEVQDAATRMRKTMLASAQKELDENKARAAAEAKAKAEEEARKTKEPQPVDPAHKATIDRAMADAAGGIT